MNELLNDPFIKLFFQQLFYIFIGLISSVYFYFILKKRFLGNFWLGWLIGVIGAVLGAFFLNEIVKYLVKFPFGINSVATLIGSIFLLWLYTVVTKNTNE